MRCSLVFFSLHGPGVAMVPASAIVVHVSPRFSISTSGVAMSHVPESVVLTSATIWCGYIAHALANTPWASSGSSSVMSALRASTTFLKPALAILACILPKARR